MISVVIPMYNSQTTIVGCISSVLNQTRVDLIHEILVINDGSTDISENTVKSEFKDIALVKVINKTNGGVSSARNLGIKLSESDWISLLDSDDIWKKDKIEKQWDKIQQYANISFIGTGRNEENVIIGKKIDHDMRCLSLKDILLKNWPHTSTALIKKAVFDDVGMFNEDYKYAEDGEMWNRIVVKYPLYYLVASGEIAGNNKLQFGESGLSANMKEMYKGNIRNIKLLKRDKQISGAFYSFMRIYYFLKYVRRLIISGRNKRL